MRNYKDVVAERQKINAILLEELDILLQSNPTQRFGQILLNHFFNNYDSLGYMSFREMVYNEEPAMTLANLQRNRNE